MEAQQVYHFTDPGQFWAELEDLISVPPDSTLDELDYALRNYIAFASTFMDEFLAAPGALDHALIALLSAPLFTSHVDRMIQSIISSLVSPSASSSSLFISLMLVLHLGENDNPLTLSGSSSSRSSTTTTGGRHHRQAGAGVTVGSSKVFRLMRRRWKEVVPVLMKWVTDAAVVEEAELVEAEADGGAAQEGGGAAETPVERKKVGMPAEGWEERVGTAATSVLYELCRVQKLTAEELADFNFDFIAHLFTLVERTRDVEDETFNYSLIKLIIALNEQFMVASSSSSTSSSSSSSHATSHTNPNVSSNGGGNLPPPILPTVAKGAKRERGPNLVLEVLKEKEHESKTFGENIIFILNRADGTPDSLCVSLLILKILYLLFTTSGTQEFFYTNDLCVLVDVFIRELCDLGEESEGLKHTYLRVLHPLLTNTQLRTYPYKRPQLRRVLEQLIAPSSYRECDPTTRRLVERNLRGSWCQGLRNQELGAGAQGAVGLGEGTGSTLSVDAIATADDGKRAARKLRHQQNGGGNGHHPPHHHHSSHHPHRRVVRRQSSLDDSSSSAYSTSSSSPYAPSVATTAATSTYISSPLSSVANGHATVHSIAERNLRGDVPPAVRASHALADASSSDTLTESPSAELAPSALEAGYDGYSAPSIEAGHDLLTPIAQRHLTGNGRVVSATHPSPSTASSSLAPPLVHPRPRSTSLSAASYRSSTHGLGLTDSPPPPTPPMPPPSPSPSVSSASTSTTTAESYYSSSGAAMGVPKQRRRPPPPPTTAAALPGTDSRPRTPSLLPPLSDAEASVPNSPRVGARRRPPPPPSAGGGRESPKQGRGAELVGGMEGLRVDY